MDLNLGSAVCRRLLSANAPLELLASCLPTIDSGVRVRVRALLDGALDGNVASARGLTAFYEQAAASLADCFARTGADAVDLDLSAHLLGLPQLDTVYDHPAAGLFQWALVGIRQGRQRPVSYPVRRGVDPVVVARYGQAMSTALLDRVSSVRRIKLAFDVSNEDIGRWTGVSSQSVSAWERGASEPKPNNAVTLTRLRRLAETFSEVVRSDRIAQTFAGRPIPLLAGHTYSSALDAGVEVDVLIDVVRRTVGRKPETEMGARWLAGPHAAAALAEYEAASGTNPVTRKGEALAEVRAIDSLRATGNRASGKKSSAAKKATNEPRVRKKAAVKTVAASKASPARAAVKRVRT